VAVGGGARSRVWSQILADVAGRPVVVPRETDAASLGAALLAAAALGHLQDPEREARRGNPAALVCSPDPAAGARYGVLRDLYDRLYEALRPVFAELAGEG
jgi:xylulokinase